jgi:hypothetical protein
LVGVLNCSMPSRKNGRFSAKKIELRGSRLTCPASLSTWLKSGLTVPLRLRLLVMPHRTFPPTWGDPPV